MNAPLIVRIYLRNFVSWDGKCIAIILPQTFLRFAGFWRCWATFSSRTFPLSCSAQGSSVILANSSTCTNALTQFLDTLQYDGRNCAAIWWTEADIQAGNTGGHSARALWSTSFCLPCVSALKCRSATGAKTGSSKYVCPAFVRVSAASRHASDTVGVSCQVHFHVTCGKGGVHVSRIGAVSMIRTLAKPCSYSAVLVLFPFFSFLFLTLMRHHSDLTFTRVL